MSLRSEYRNILLFGGGDEKDAASGKKSSLHMAWANLAKIKASRRVAQEKLRVLGA